MKAIEVKNLNVSFGNFKVLDNISFDVEEGNITAVIGPNGSGKSTLLKAIMSLIPYKGEILIYGKPNYEQRKLIGYVPQHFEIEKFLPMTVKEFLEFNLTEETLPKKSHLEHHLKELDILNYKDKLLRELSGGQLQRVLFCRALINDPKILLLDEPISEIDIAGQKEFYEIIRFLNKEHKLTILLVTHEITIVHHFATHVICLNKKLVCNGPITLLFKEEILKELYGREIFVYPFNKPLEKNES
jgi:zinc transport system ATP-binding protein